MKSSHSAFCTYPLRYCQRLLVKINGDSAVVGNRATNNHLAYWMLNKSRNCSLY